MGKSRTKVWRTGRILYFHEKADADFWDKYWTGSITKELFKPYEEGNLDEFSLVFEKYLGKDDRILEAGCGTGRYIVALLARGYRKIEGIEWGRKTIEKVRSIYPDLPVSVGDVLSVDVPDHSYDGYISLGVVEHRVEGPEPFLTEAFRILRPGGYAIFSVPYVNALRKIKGQLGRYLKEIPGDGMFYQYAFGRSEFTDFLQKAGFNLIETQGAAGYFCLNEELPTLFSFLDKLPGGWRIKEYVKRSNWINYFGHIMIFVCRKPFEKDTPAN